MPQTSDDRTEKLAGVLLGTAVGDALGLPRENMSRRRAMKFFGGPPLSHCFLFGRGMMSDDTEHTAITAQALLSAPDSGDAFGKALSRNLRRWFLTLPAGMGLATARACLKLGLGFSFRSSGVYSAGNGPAMRAAILGVCFGEDPQRLRGFIRACTRITHTDPRAERGALLVALAAYRGASRGSMGADSSAFFHETRAVIAEPDEELAALLTAMEAHLARRAPARELADSLGLERGVSGYIYHTVPMALYCWLINTDDFRKALEEVILLGGDTDTTAAVLGAVMGATVGASGIPREWLDGILDWPRSVAWLWRLAARLGEQFSAQPLVAKGPAPLFWPALIPRNVLFLLIVLVHGFRRLLPPY